MKSRRSFGPDTSRSLHQRLLSLQVTIESLITEAEAARAKAMEEKGGAAAAVSALIAKAKLAGMWREKVDKHNTGTGTVSTADPPRGTFISVTGKVTAKSSTIGSMLRR